jgi:Zn-dependent M28 family amino/carboxypeptidase
MSSIRVLLLAFVALGLGLPLHAQQKLSGTRAYTYAKQYVDTTGPRWIGSPGHAKAENFFRTFFAVEKKAGRFEEDTFSASTPIGLLPMHNFIVRYPGRKDGLIVVATHYETNYPLRETGFVGANDGGATTGLLLELATYLRSHPNTGYTIALVFDDGEEAIRNWSSSDSLYGSKHLAVKWSNDGTLKKIKAYILTDMIGDRDLNLNFEENSTPWLRDTLRQAAKNTGHTSSIFKSSMGVEDDHLPFLQRGVPVLDMIDIDYGPHTVTSPDGWHHTPQDTMDKVSAHSLQISADLLLETIRLVNQK